MELILIQLDMAHLLTAVQRVCKQWQRIIAHSSVLQRHLFFKAVPSTPSPSDLPLSPPDRRLNPLLYKHFDMFFPYDPDQDLQTQRLNREKDYSRPFAPEREGIIPPDFSMKYITWPTAPDSSLPIADVRNGGFRHYAFTRKGASWRQMLVSQPPPVRVARLGDMDWVDIQSDHVRWSTEEMMLECRIPRRILQGVPKRMIKLEGGLRMGDLFDELWNIQFAREYALSEMYPWCAWRVPESLTTTFWQWVNYTNTGGSCRMPTTELAKWVDGADLVIGGIVPSPSWASGQELCWRCQGKWGEKVRGKRCKDHLAIQQRYRCQEHQARGPLSLAPGT
ncbi:hypothetical protein QBC47DRAFT_371086 [Echria macrotheca]|uniref:F-box domain-containing protein n=1 Tax=Echria macrotheca TaxID=438768 RepID=A0AAJ0F9I1_9PEZI|nr:hypothetical protein QBC47DRAFT_371086 [Echria macrotheca]